MKSSILMLVFLVLSQMIRAQEYIVQGTTPTLYLNHVVAAKDTWYSIGRLYNLPPKDIAAFNRMNMEQPLEISQRISVPLTTANFTQDEAKAAGEVLVPVYHIIAEKEWMYRISVNHNKVPVERLEKWNNMKNDDAKAGTRLIVGFLKVKEQHASLAPATADAAGAATPPKPRETSTASTPPPQTQSAATPPAQPPSQGGAKGRAGHFRSLYKESGKSSSGVAGIFKSTSGWEDGKYYALMSNVVVGTIIRVTFPQTNKVIFAKVLGELPEMKESAGLALRISDAAAGELGAVNNKFSVDIRY